MGTQKKELSSGICLSVLIYRDDDEGCFAAVALEMDIWGYGKTSKKAFQELVELVEMQISFAMFKEQPELIWKAADPVWFQRFADARRDQLREQVMDISRQEEPEYKASGMPIPPAHVIAQIGKQFRSADA